MNRKQEMAQKPDRAVGSSVDPPPPPRASIIRETWGNFETEEGGVEVREEA